MEVRPQSVSVAGETFTNQGTLDWTRLSESTVSCTLEILRRCAAAGVDAYTVAVGQAIARRFPLSPQGEKRIQQALTDLKVYSGFANVLSFGFGLRSFVRTLGTTSEGRSLLSLCAALSDCFPDSFAADVIHHIVLSFQPPEELRPSLQEWLMVVQACSGSLSTTKFAVLAEGFMRLDPRSRTLSKPNCLVGLSEDSTRGHPEPKAVADALVGVGKVASKELKAISIIGCAAAGWVAAVAQWLFNLSVEIQDSNGNILYSEDLPHDDVQIRIVFDTDAPKSTNLQLVGQTYHIRDITELYRTYASKGEDYIPMEYSGRLSWDTCLESTFGLDFERLMKIPTNFGLVFGSAARILTSLVRGDPSLDTEACNQQSYFNSSSGQGLVVNALRWLPELKSARKHMDAGVRFSLHDAFAQYEERLEAIRRTCGCPECNSSFEPSGAAFCLVLISETILVLCQILAGLNIAKGLLPLRIGIEEVYNRQSVITKDKQQTPSRSEGNRERPEPIFRILEHTTRAGWGVWDDQTVKRDTRISESLLLFASRNYGRQWWPEISAACQNGICAYLDVLNELSFDPETVGRVHVVPGRIERCHKQYQIIEDPQAKLDTQRFSLTASAELGKLNQASLEVTETMRGLSVSYFLHSRDTGNHKLAYHIGPADFVGLVSEARGRIVCPRIQPHCPRFPSENIVEDHLNYPLVSRSLHNTTLIFIDSSFGNTFMRAALFMIAGEGKRTYRLIRDGQCLDCCLREAEKHDGGGPSTRGVIV